MAASSAWRSRGPFFWDFSRRLVSWATWVPVAICFNTFVAEVTFIKGGSMYPFLNEDRDSTLRSDVALNWKLYPHLGLARGMIVTFKSPLDPAKTAVKRIVGLEGDLVWSRHSGHYDAIRVPKGHIWVEGDAGNDKDSLDSNTYGPISYAPAAKCHSGTDQSAATVDSGRRRAGDNFFPSASARTFKVISTASHQQVDPDLLTATPQLTTGHQPGC
ncbi:hypothetical protein jhhlp_003658 [Lomentospora prolificans]|uniref:Mitochondrial inner membrane protease subunit 2 n=1 Tax=Lomentospora prolificans TaxID=41688 RepID=A0A2N3N9D6_9PEZI|nr:hypothetical protein jhhlp_003658 [Lomentospora prolificans]